ncbi:hypothetical protein R0131_00255 [Clostridium sp. AL.422]|uniref:hypothetical protein n=1 Tax=Clostridium TaxID=1485 RepID=UPI00293DA559|nr:MULTISPECIES: hypothetical protein [unclassified Clostridium]MDV4149259.1 hypothetical protein [Clostridium sp. AL.422]
MCLTSNLMSQEKIVVLKATSDTVNDVIKNGIYALTNLPNNYARFEKFVLVDDGDANEAKVLAIGNISEPYAINENSKSVNIFNNTNWKWEYELSNIVDLRGDTLTLEDVFMEQGLNEINYTVQF